MKFILVAGARPNFMKVAPLLEAFRRRNHKDVLLVHTGQHYDPAMSGRFFQDLGIRAPDINLRVGSGSHAAQTARIMIAFERVCMNENPDWVVVVGDVNSTLACALTARKLGIRVAHVEAGLRSRDMAMPEEINRVCTDAISNLLFTTDSLADENLRNEGVPSERIRCAGNTMIDTLLRNLDRALATPLLPGLVPGRFAVLTLHRPSNVDDPVVLSSLLEALSAVAAQLRIVFPVHPRTLPMLSRIPVPIGIQATEPLSYLDFIGLVARSRMVLTDSGGIQEETTVLGVPCVTMRPNTERPITCLIGTNILAGADPKRIREIALSVLNGPPRFGTVPPLWDGHAADRIVDALLAARTDSMPEGASVGAYETGHSDSVLSA
jgi:UDP-N-acetylglucosamine 2-epimerase (non-hydrolysing)